MLCFTDISDTNITGRRLCEADAKLKRLGKACNYAYTVCPRSSDQFYVVTYYIKWVTTSWTHSIIRVLFGCAHGTYIRC